jgi:hypothetical protein
LPDAFSGRAVLLPAGDFAVRLRGRFFAPEPFVFDLAVIAGSSPSLL